MMPFDEIEAYRRMYLIRHTEEEIARRYPEGKMRCPTHLSIGQEGVAVGVCMALEEGDLVFSNHRAHAHYLAKGGDLRGLIAELYGKATGCCGGWGGSMHIMDDSVGFMGTSPIVGSAVSIATGMALAIDLSNKSQRVVVFMGDAALETGQVWESFNFAATKRLPILFVCENNGYATSTPLAQRQKDTDLYRRVAAFMWAERCIDVPKTVFSYSMGLLDRLPALLQVNTYRFSGHVGPGDDHEIGYRPQEELAYARVNDQVKLLRRRLPARVAQDIEGEVDNMVSGAFAFAEAASWPKSYMGG